MTAMTVDQVRELLRAELARRKALRASKGVEIAIPVPHGAPEGKEGPSEASERVVDG